MTLVGADVDQLQTLARTFTQAADRLESITTEVTGRLSAQTWAGPDASRFRNEWQSKSGAMRAAASALRDAATDLTRNASEQAQASAAGDGTGGGSAVPSECYEKSPTSTAGLYDRLRQVTGEDKDGLQVDVVRDPKTGQERAIVYIGGTDPFSGTNQPVLGNIEGFTNHTKQSQIDEINAKLKAMGLDSKTPIMLVGYSQGGMDAQLLAESGKLHGDVGAVVTYGSPIVTAVNSGYQTVHLQDAGDPIPKLSQPWWAIQNSANGDVFQGRSTNDVAEGIANAASSAGGPVAKVGTAVVSGLWVHGNQSTYEQVSQQFDDSSKYAKQKDVIKQFQGDIVG